MNVGLRLLAAANLALVVIFPLSWFAPLLRAGILPLFGMSEITVVSGLASLWETDPLLALLVSFLAIFAPMLKTLGLGLVQFGLLSPRTLPALAIIGRLAMGDVFLIALYVIVVRGAGMATVETAWGLWLFSSAVLASLAIGWLSERILRGRDDGKG